MKWLFMLLWDPARALDWMDYRKTPPTLDHGKVVPDLVIVLILVLMVVVTVRTNELPPVLYPILVVSGAFGQAIWAKFIASKSVVQTTTETVTETKAPPVVTTEKVTEFTAPPLKDSST